MRRVTYTVFTVACVVLLHGGIHGAELSTPASITPANRALTSDEETRTLLVAQAEGAQGEKPTGEIEERAVPRIMPGGGVPTPVPPPRQMVPGATAPLPARPIQPAATPPPPPLPGEFVIQTMKQTFLTAVDGGGRTTNVIHTDATGIASWEKFRLLGGGGYGPSGGQYVIQTMSGNYLTAVNGGGQSGPAGGTDVLHTDATQIGSWEQFRFGLDQYGWRNAIQTVNGHYLTAVGGGGKITDAIHTDAVNAAAWEYFYVWKCGDLGSGYQYTISAISVPYGSLFAYGGGGLVATHSGVFVTGAIGILSDYNLRPAPFDNNWQRFRLIRQGDGSYALQTSNGINYVTAIQGGGLPSGTIAWDDLVTDRTQVQAWEQFRFVDQGNCTYVIQTVRGIISAKLAPHRALQWEYFPPMSATSKARQSSDC